VAFSCWRRNAEIHERLEGEEKHERPKQAPSFSSVIMQIALLDIIFSLDSVITAVGMANELWVMITAVVIALGIMLASSGPIKDFVNRHPTVKMLALSFLLLIGKAIWVSYPRAHLLCDGFSCLLRYSTRLDKKVNLFTAYAVYKRRSKSAIGQFMDWTVPGQVYPLHLALQLSLKPAENASHANTLFSAGDPSALLLS
jgi:hypothetical protein